MTSRLLRRGLAGAALLLLTLVPAAPVSAQKTAKEAEKLQNPDDYRQFLVPGPRHRALDPLVGTWRAKLRVWNHGTPPVESSLDQTLDTRWILDGNFLQTEFTSKFAAQDRRYRGYVFRSYNTGFDHYTAVLMSEGDVRETVSTGTYDEATKTFTFKGDERDPVLGDRFTRKEVYTFVDADHFRYQLLYVFKDGSEIRAAEGVFERTGKAPR